MKKENVMSWQQLTLKEAQFGLLVTTCFHCQMGSIVNGSCDACGHDHIPPIPGKYRLGDKALRPLILPDENGKQQIIELHCPECSSPRIDIEFGSLRPGGHHRNVQEKCRKCGQSFAPRVIEDSLGTLGMWRLFLELRSDHAWQIRRQKQNTREFPNLERNHRALQRRYGKLRDTYHRLGQQALAQVKEIERLKTLLSLRNDEIGRLQQNIDDHNRR